LGNPVTADYDTVASLATTRDQLGSLPFAEKEARAIADLFGVKPLIGKAATESAVREQVSQANILHLAAHGEFNPVAPLNSLIALAPDDNNDGWLTVGETYGLNLKKTDLVVLSACETNLGDLSKGDELVGLTRALIFAGTPSVIASLWQVEDAATSLLMERFYTHLKDGMGKAESLRQAQLEVREEYPNPYYWSAFVLSGDGG
jgi:CHAT domain-containing protein